jgi:uncharacterized protein YcbX
VHFHLDRDRGALEEWFSAYFSLPLKLAEDAEWGFPDDTELPGPTVVSTATLQTVSDWFDLALEETRRRFRANLEVDGVEPFWEDRLYAQAGSGIRFSIGEVRLLGANPCQRCVVPSRDVGSGEPIAGFAHKFAEHRQQTLPEWAERSRFDHFYRLAVNTRLQRGGTVRVGDRVEIG